MIYQRTVPEAVFKVRQSPIYSLAPRLIDHVAFS